MRIGNPKNHAIEILDIQIEQYAARRIAVAKEAYEKEQELAKLDDILLGLRESIVAINKASMGHA